MINPHYETLKQILQAEPARWVVTGVAGFIGSHLLETLLLLDQHVVGLDNFSTGFSSNLELVHHSVSAEQWQRFHFIEGDIRDQKTCERVFTDADYVLHQAALSAVPASIADPMSTHYTNVNGFLSVLMAAKRCQIQRLIYASSSLVYGDDLQVNKVEDSLGSPNSPFAASKRINELYAETYAKCYDVDCIGLRYFTVFGRRQHLTESETAPVSHWIECLRQENPLQIMGDGTQQRDYCYVANVVQANLLAATTRNSHAVNQVYNIGSGTTVSQHELAELCQSTLRSIQPSLPVTQPQYCDSQAHESSVCGADISKAQQALHYQPSHTLSEGVACLVSTQTLKETDPLFR